MANVPWKELFTGAAVASFVASFFAFIGNLAHAGFLRTPATFASIIAFMAASVFMLAMDVPVKGVQCKNYLYEVGFRFGLFMTRFTGRGLWYMFLGSMSWVLLYDEAGTSVQSMLGVATGLYLTGLGVYTFNAGCALTNRLNSVRVNMQKLGDLSEAHFVPPKRGVPTAMTLEQFRALFEQHDPRAHSDYEIEYMLNAISTKPFHNSSLSTEEVDAWLASSSKFMYLV